MPGPGSSAAMRQALQKRAPNAFEMAIEAGLTDNLKIVIDPGWDLSYPGGQYALNPIGGDMFSLGDAGTVETSDPTLNGVPGRRSKEEYFSLDGGDWLTATANPSWAQNLHKDGAILTLATWVYVASISVNQDVLGTAGPSGAGRTGIRNGFVITSGNFQFIAYNANTSVFSGSSSAAAALVGEWALYMLSFEEGVSRRLSRGSASGYATATGASTYTGPATGNAQSVWQYGAVGGGANPLSAGSRLGPGWVWEGRALTDAELQALFGVSRGRFGV